VVPCLLIYDIPQASGVANPSPSLRRRAVRINLSCWVILEADIPYSLLNEMHEGGATWHVVKFDVAERARLCQMAIESIRKTVRDLARKAAIASDRANACDTADSDYRRFRTAAARAIRQFHKVVRDCKAAASRFGIDSQLDLADSISVVDAMDSQVKRRMKAYVEVKDSLPPGDPMAGAAIADAVPGVILADYAEDRGLEGQGQELREACFDAEVGV
jgi:hypothetical protein